MAGAVWRDQVVPSAEDRRVPALPTATKRPAPKATSFSCVVVPEARETSDQPDLYVNEGAGSSNVRAHTDSQAHPQTALAVSDVDVLV